MVKHGQAPFLECSSQGNRKLSAFYARPRSLAGKSIEEAYQAMKVFSDGSTGLNWRLAKGKKAVNQKECAEQYEQWWREYLSEHPELSSLVKSSSGLSDRFGQVGHVCQATTLWRIRETLP